MPGAVAIHGNRIFVCCSEETDIFIPDPIGL